MVQLVIIMTTKMQSLQEAIRKAICHYDGFYSGNQKLDVLSVSEIGFYKPELCPVDIDESILEKCEGGNITASFNLAHDPHQEESSKIVTHYSNVQIDFEVIDYQNQKFTVQITNNMILL